MPRELSLAEIFQTGYYWETKILLTAVKLDLFSALDGRSDSPPDLAKRLSLDERALSLVLNALVAMRVLTKHEGRFANTSVARKHLVKVSPDYVGHLLVLHDSEWMNWGKLEETVRTGASPVRRHVFETNPEMGANVLAVLDRIGRGSGVILAKVLQLGGVERMLDVGGGAGTNAIAFCREYPGLSATVFDLPSTLQVTERSIKEAGLEDRIAVMPGNFNTDSLGGLYDLVLLSDVLHYQDAQANAALVHKAFAHLTDAGRLVIKDRFLDPDRTSPAWTTAFAVHILVNTEEGQCFTTQEAMEWMTRAGFASVTELEPRAIVQGIKSGED
ncbi:MAG: methyltransferase [Nitrospira sp.]|nr:methyltransferase [Nitrospira sp.]MCY4132513.1 methyltransferase [Nitrospira sp.]